MLCVAAAQVRTCLEFLRLLQLMVLHSIRSGRINWDGMGWDAVIWASMRWRRRRRLKRRPKDAEQNCDELLFTIGNFFFFFSSEPPWRQSSGSSSSRASSSSCELIVCWLVYTRVPVGTELEKKPRPTDGNRFEMVDLFVQLGSPFLVPSRSTESVHVRTYRMHLFNSSL